MAKKKLKEKGVKKKWFTVMAPSDYGELEVGETPAFESKEILGRKIEISFKELGGGIKNQYQKVLLKIIKVQGDTAQTEAEKYKILNSYLQRISRRAKERILTSKVYNTKDDQKIRIKTFILLNNRVKRAIRTALLKEAESIITSYVKNNNVSIMFTQQAIKTLALGLKKDLKTIYSNTIVISKIEKE